MHPYGLRILKNFYLETMNIAFTISILRTNTSQKSIVPCTRKTTNITGKSPIMTGHQTRNGSPIQNVKKI